MKQKWELRQPDRNTASSLSRQLGLKSLTAKLLNNRSIYHLEDAQRFLKPSLKDLPPPTVLEDMDTATSRIVTAIENKENILVFGDYDVDGITATTLLCRFLNDAGARVSFYIPDRITEGYGLKKTHITACALDRKVTLIITVDCGSSNHEAILAAQRHGIDVIVTDHHEMPDELPKAIAVINPKRKDNAAGLDNLAGVGVAFYLIINVRLELRKMGFWHAKKEPNLRSYCDLVALGTVADVTPMVRENRILTKAGLEVLQSTDNGSLQTLMAQCGIDKRYVDAMDIAFKLAPRLNAAGRVAHADAAMALLTADNPAAAARQADHLTALNQKRRKMEKILLQEIDACLDQDPSMSQTNIIMLHGRGWHMGILGIVASRLVDRFARPVVILTLEGNVAKGSARSIPGVDLSGLFNTCARHLTSFGGHAMAAGLQLPAHNIDAFRGALEENAAAMTSPGMAVPTLMIDDMLDFKLISRDLILEIDLLKPFGEKNPEPVFMAQNVQVMSSKTLSGGHRRMTLRQVDGPRFQAIQFNPAPQAAALDFFKKMAYRVQLNRWNGRENIQLVVEDILN